MEHEKQIPIWFFIGVLLALYGVIIAGYGIISWNEPPPPQLVPQIARLHANVWWGALVACLGFFYAIKFRPREGESLTGEEDTSGEPRK
jgi:hypothetical protein